MQLKKYFSIKSNFWKMYYDFYGTLKKKLK